ncbi:uncharacterized protein LOC113373956 [Ctenocephalides felis]|uniref:uncharacterized protein LOC113373956 n=1 Tax=Ctenocephalides felis TaxID=7515 RepID=UPI000E6E38D0|nr:uncharacterized protein LOC113373956 [Ctenocephalides felis]
MKSKRKSAKTKNSYNKRLYAANAVKKKDVVSRKEQQRICKEKLRSDSVYRKSEGELNKNRIAHLRKDESFRRREKVSNRIRLATTRHSDNNFARLENEKHRKRIAIKRKNDEIFKINEKNKNKVRMREYRKNESIRLAEYMARKREDNVHRERRRNELRMKFLRQGQYKLSEINKNIERNIILRQNYAYNQLENNKNKLRNRLLRQNYEYRTSENYKNIRRNSDLRHKLPYRTKEMKNNIERNMHLRRKSLYRTRENEKNMIRNNRLRQAPNFSINENKNNTFRNKILRKNREFRLNEARSNISRMRMTRNIAHYSTNEKIKNIDRMRKSRHDKVAYRKELKKNAEHKLKNRELDFIKYRENIYNQLKTFDKFYPFAELQQKFIHLRAETTSYICCCYLEERMVAPILNFMQIRALKPYALNPQLGLKGSVVNISIQINDLLNVLPRKFNQMKTIQIKLKRNISHKSDYMFETVDQKYLDMFDSGVENVNFIVDDKDLLEDELSESTNDGDDNPPPQPTIDFNQINNDEVLLIDNNTNVAHDNSSKISIIAPGQSKYPLPWHKMDDLDELCFPKLFGGHSFSSQKISYKDRARSEVRRFDRRSCIPTRILFMAKKSLEIACMSNINICLRRSKKNLAKKIVASDAIDSNFINDLVKFDDGYRFLKNIRSSPAFWEDKKKKLLAMIRQLGRPTFFLTLSAAESQWPELLKTLMKYSEYNKNISLREAYALDHNTKTTLIRNDPVTCSRYFDYKVNKFMWMLRQANSIFGEYEVIDSYERVEFQQRGSPHEHILLWLNNAPKYDSNCNESNNNTFIDFIDRFITCKNDSENPYVKLQIHKHGRTCYKGQRNKECRFHIPYPVMKKTMILEPLSKDEQAPKQYKTIRDLMNKLYRENKYMSYEDILKELGMNETEYILSIRSSLKQKRVFLKRSSLEVAVNAYNSNILKLFESNMDLQIILDEYAVISYVTNYISKIEGGLSKLLREAAMDCDNNNKSIKEKFCAVTNVFLNSNLMSAQEAAYHVLSLSLSKQSRKTIFINTRPTTERVSMLKSIDTLKQLNKDSTEIYVEDLFSKYSKRVESLEYVCLADYAANYENRKKKSLDIEDDIDINDEEIEIISRQKSAIIRYTRYKLYQDPANYYREKILLFMPWRNELQEVENVNFEQVFIDHKRIIEDNQRKFAIISDETLDDALKLMNSNNFIMMMNI